MAAAASKEKEEGGSSSSDGAANAAADSAAAVDSLSSSSPRTFLSPYASAAKQRGEAGRFLRESGLDEAELDPASLEALGEILLLQASSPSSSRSQHSANAGGGGNGTGGSSSTGAPAAVAFKFPSGKLCPLPSSPSPPPEGDAVTSARILRKLDEQARMIAELRDRVEDISAALRISGRGRDGADEQGGSAPQPRPPPLPRQPPQPLVPPPAGAAGPPPPPPAGAAAADAEAPAPPPRATWVGSLVNYLAESRPAKVARLFLELRRRQVPDADLGGFLRVLAMVGILAARLSARQQQQQEARRQLGEAATLSERAAHLWRLHRVPLLVTLGVWGYMVHSGYARFLYNFLVEEDYAGRIWNGEDIDPDQVVARARERDRLRQLVQNRPAAAGPGGAAPPEEPAAAGGPRPPPPPPHPQQARADGGAPAVGQYVLGGQIPRHDEGDGDDEDGGGGARGARRRVQRLPAPVRLLVEVGLLLSSFVLSIFPTWTPVAAPRDRADHGPDEDEGDDAASQDEGAGGHDSDNDGDGRDDDDDPDWLPRVRPPRDPAEYEDED